MTTSHALAIADIAAEETRAAFPTYRLTGTPYRAYFAWRYRAASGALACLAGLASG
jgi:hypothetical protein